MRKIIVYVFIDSQNLNLGTSKDIYRGKKKIYTGWKLDFKKFRKYLFDKFRVQKAFLCIGYIKHNQKLYNMLRAFGYELIFKPTVADDKGKAKGNVDAELVLHTAAIQFSKYDKAVIVSGDGDFYCLYDKIFIVRDKEKVEYKNKRSLLLRNKSGRRGALPRR